ncbi:Cuticle Protein RR-2 28 [Gryllus bimaculatus]|nr:Cuticle Protein RR-2 28 [Gryllus bimaculatus]
MAKILLLLAVAAAVCSVLAEPPVDRTYLPPGSGGYSGGPGGRPSPVRFSGSGAPSPVYGAPGAGGRGLGGAGGSSYSAAAAGAPSRLGNGPAPVYGAPGFGGYNGALSGTTEDPLAEPANYEFQYEVQDFESGTDFGHQESRQDEFAQGEYRVVLPDGRTQIVEYEATPEGYKPQIRYEETAEGAAAAQRAEQRAQAIRDAVSGLGGYNYDAPSGPY